MDEQLLLQFSVSFWQDIQLFQEWALTLMGCSGVMFCSRSRNLHNRSLLGRARWVNHKMIVSLQPGHRRINFQWSKNLQQSGGVPKPFRDLLACLHGFSFQPWEQLHMLFSFTVCWSVKAAGALIGWDKSQQTPRNLLTKTTSLHLRGRKACWSALEQNIECLALDLWPLYHNKNFCSASPYVFASQCQWSLLLFKPDGLYHWVL